MRVRNLIFTVLLIVIAVGLSAAQPVTKISFEAAEYFDPFGIIGTPVGYYEDFGTLFCPGDEPTGDPELPCPEGGRTHLRDTIWVSRVESLTPEFPSGWMTINGNANLDPDFNGPQWGTFSLAYDGGGYLEGRWQGVRRMEGEVWVTVLHATGKVVGGEYDGATVIISDRITTFTPIPIAYIGEIEGTVINP